MYTDSNYIETKSIVGCFQCMRSTPWNSLVNFMATMKKATLFTMFLETQQRPEILVKYLSQGQTRLYNVPG